MVVNGLASLPFTGETSFPRGPPSGVRLAAGVSLLSPCNLRFRRAAPDGWERRSLNPAPRSAYLLQGPARGEWEHSIPGVKTQRYSVTFRGYRGD